MFSCISQSLLSMCVPITTRYTMPLARRLNETLHRKNKLTPLFCRTTKYTGSGHATRGNVYFSETGNNQRDPGYRFILPWKFSAVVASSEAGFRLFGIATNEVNAIDKRSNTTT